MNSDSTSAPAQVVAAGHVLLGHQVHPVAEGGDQHDVGGQVQGRHLLLGERLVQIANGGPAHRGVIAIDAPDDPLDLVAEALIFLHPFPAGAGHLNQDGVAGVELALVEQLTVGPQAMQMPLV